MTTVREHAKQHTKLHAPVIAIDGPTASGKGTVAQQVAQRLGFDYLDSGALYRLLALASLRRQLAVQDVAALTLLARELHIVFRDGYIKLDGVNVSNEIRAEEIGNRASEIALHAPIRLALLARQRALRTLPGLVADGRDMGTVVFPDANLKVFLTASVEARAQRRYKQLIEKGFPASIEILSQDLAKRDARDIQRVSAPLKPAEDAKILDTSNLGVEQVVGKILEWFVALSTPVSHAHAGS